MTAMPLGALSQSIRCTYPKCTCECFSSAKNQIRTCQNCKHGWIAHALDKLISTNLYPGISSQTESITPSIVFDLASLVLYDCQAIPIRVKILLDRLFSSLQHDEVLQILHGFGWSYEDYARGYIVQDPSGRVIEKHSIVLKEEENIVIQQFLRFAETRSVAQELLTQEIKSLQDAAPNQSQNISNTKSESDIRKFIERNNMALIQSYNLALRRAFDNPQSLFSAMGAAFPAAHLNMAAAAAASQFGRGFPPTSGMMAMPTASFAQAVSSKPEPLAPTDQAVRRLSEPYDLTNKRSPESQKSYSPTLSTSALSLNANPPAATTPTAEPRATGPDINSAAGSLGLRKTTSPLPNLIRRPTSPASGKGWPFNNPSFGQTVFVTSSGKKRVLCTACNKTFCDKGALKIHYSAVHLKEMHQCTIPGCNMMFSSRRSRNRHSANPNPKLHTPQTRRPRERYDPAQDQILAMMGVPPGAKSSADDGSSSVDENETAEDKMVNSMSNNMMEKSMNGSDDGRHDEFGDDDLDDELPTQLKQESPLYGSSKRKRLMPTRVASAVELGSLDDDAKSDGGKSITSESRSINDTLDVDDSQDALPQDSYMRDNSEPGEVRSRSPAEPGEVIRNKNDEKKFMNSFPPSLPSPEKQASAMHSLFSSLLPPNSDTPTSDFWSNFIQQTAAAQKEAQRRVEEEERNKGDSVTQYSSTTDGCSATFPNRQSRDLHKMNLKTHNVVSHHSRDIYDDDEDDDDETNGNRESKSYACRYCDKLFPTRETMNKHVDSVHNGQETMFPDQAYSSHIDSIKTKTPVVA